MRKVVIAVALPLFLAACGAESVWAPDEAVDRARYVSGEEPSITLFTVVRKTGGGGEHSGLMIDGSQRVLFDPAGTWHLPSLPERNDLFYGITPRMKAFYIDYHARETYDVVEQRVPVSAEVAEMAIRKAQGYGAVNKVFCGTSVSSILKGLPGFESVSNTFFPGKIMREFGELPGVTTKVHHDGDPDNNHGILLVQAQTAQ